MLAVEVRIVPPAAFRNRSCPVVSNWMAATSVAVCTHAHMRCAAAGFAVKYRYCRNHTCDWLPTDVVHEQNDVVAVTPVAIWQDSAPCAARALSDAQVAPDPMVTTSKAAPEAPPELPAVTGVPDGV